MGRSVRAGKALAEGAGAKQAAMSPGCFFCAAKGLGQAGKEGHPEKGQGRLVKNLPAMQETPV